MAPAVSSNHQFCTDGDWAFPADFIWGVSTAAFQIEGASEADGRGLGIWDRFTTVQQGSSRSGGNTACNHYNLFEKDVSLLQQLGLRHYNFSVAWPRVQPTGRGPTNQAGLDFYCRLVDCLVRHGIEPIVTLYHWDLPADLQAEFGGWASREIVPLFAAYAREVFSALGRRGVRRWVTLHEPWCVAVFGYGRGIHAPGVVAEDPATLYQVGHHLLLAHAEAARVFREDLRLHAEGGRIGVALSADWAEPAPAPESKEHRELNAEAAERVLHCSIGWFAGPIYTGDYPAAMRSRCPELPQFSPQESALLRRSADFLCIWHHNVELIQAAIPKGTEDGAQEYEASHGKDASTWQAASVQILKDPAWPLNDAGETQTPWALRKVLLWVQQHYKPRGGIIVMAPGFGSPDCSRQRAVDDTERVQFMHDYICAMRSAMADGADVRGYFAWTLLDSFEWQTGYNLRYGLVHVDFTTQKRTPKASARWYSRLVGQRAQVPAEQDLDLYRSCRALSASGEDRPLWWAVDANESVQGVQRNPSSASGDTVHQALLAIFQNASVEDETHQAALASLDPQSIFCTLEAIERHLQSCCGQPPSPGALRAPGAEGLRRAAAQAASDLRDARAVHALATRGGDASRGGAGAAEGAGGSRRQREAARRRWEQALDRASRWKLRQLALLWGPTAPAAARYAELARVGTATLAAALLQQRPEDGQAEEPALPGLPGAKPRQRDAEEKPEGSAARSTLLSVFQCGQPEERGEWQGEEQGALPVMNGHG